MVYGTQICKRLLNTQSVAVVKVKYLCCFRCVERTADFPVAAGSCMRAVVTAVKTSSTAQTEPREKDGERGLLFHRITLS